MRQSMIRKLAVGGVGLLAFAGIGLAVAGPSGAARPLDRQASFQTGYGVDDLHGDCRLVEVTDASGKVGRALLAPCD